jgi:hypothetical protein
MKRLRTALTALGLIGTGLLLVATSTVQPSGSSSPGSIGTCAHPAQQVTFIARGSCGPSGTVQVTTVANSCTIDAIADSRLGLPPSGAISPGPNTDLHAGGWTLTGTLVDVLVVNDVDGGADAGTVAREVLRTCTASVADGGLLLECDPGALQFNGYCVDLLVAQP